MATTIRSNKDLVRRVFETLNARDTVGFADTHAEDVVLHDHDEEVQGVDAAIEHELAIYGAFPDMKYTPEAIVAEGDTVAARWRATGTHDGEFEGIAPTGEEIDITACGLMRVADGEIAEVWLTYDRLGMLQQLGVVEPPAGKAHTTTIGEADDGTQIR